METISVAKYLWTRMRQVGTSSIMGVPGDFNMNFLDAIYEVPGLDFIGNSNELNAAYAADGYARVKGVPGCLVTTHGVGELSAINGMAGAASEHVPVVQVVGQTLRPMQAGHKLIHHSIGDWPDHQQYNKVSAPIRAAAAELWDPAKATAAIDHAIRECIIRKQPVYIFFPMDLTNEQIPAETLKTPIDLTLPVDKENEDAAVNAIISILKGSKKPCVFIDHLVHSYGKPQARKLVDKLELPIYASHMGKGCVDETHPKFVGLYNSSLSFAGIAEEFEEMAFSRKMPDDRRIDVMDTYVVIKGKRIEGVYMAPLLERLHSAIDPTAIPKVPKPTVGGMPKAPDHNATKITQSWIWTRLGEFLRPGDVVLADTGTAAFGLPDASFPSNLHYICQTYYGSIGFITPCAFGADLALREMHQADKSNTPRGRTILVTGDGSFQLTMQELGTMIARKLQVIVIIINNNGYTIERAIHGARQHLPAYNNILPIKYSYLPHLFSHPNPSASYMRATTKAEMEACLQEKRLSDPSDVQILEVLMDKLDIPWRLSQYLKRRQEKYMRDEGFTNVD